MERNNKILSVAVVLIILAVGAAGLGFFSKKEVQVNKPVVTPAAQKEFVTLRVYSSTSASMYPTQFAEKLGYLEEEGIKLEYTGVIQGGPEGMMSVASDANDITSIVHLSAVVNAKARGVKLKAVFTGSGFNANTSSRYFVLNNSGIFTAKDLKGKKFGCNTLGASCDYTIQEYLKQNNMTRDDVQILAIGAATTREQAFRTGQIDVLSGNKRFYAFKEGGGVRPLFSSYGVYKRGSNDNLILMREQYIKEHPDVVRRFVAANVRAIDWINAHPEEAKDVLRKIIIDANGERGKPEDADYVEFGVSNHGLIAEEDLQYWIDNFVESGTLKPGQIKPSDLYTNEFNPYFKK